MAFYSAFQWNSIQLNSAQVFAGASTRGVIGGVSDNFLPDDYKKYRKKLEKLARISDDYNESKYVKEVQDLTEIAKVLEIHAPISNTLAAYVKDSVDVPYFDVSALRGEIITIQNRINEIIKFNLQLEQELEDETILLMLM